MSATANQRVANSDMKAAVHLPNADRPLTDESGDRYGFVGLARKLAPPISAAADGDGLVVGIEGSWGTGKTSLLHFLKKALNDERSQGLRVIALAPWLQGDRIDLVTDLMTQISAALDAEVGADTGRGRLRSRLWRARRSQTTVAIRNYTVMAGRGAGAALDVLGHLMPGAAIGGRMAQGGADLLEAALRGPSVLDLKAEVRRRIEGSGLRFVVLIDDLDRLEPTQAAEVVRVVRSVADFPRMVYVLSYDRAVLARALQHSLGVDDGDQYLQKIVQLALPMPAFEPFDLRTELQSQLQVLHKEIEGSELKGKAWQDLQRAVDQAGGHLGTPRDVTLAANAVRFAWLASRGDTYFPDVCLIQIIKVTQPKLYRWLERYLALHSMVITKAGHLPKRDREVIGQELAELLPDEDHRSSESVWSLHGIVPGLIGRIKDEDGGVFEEVSEREVRDLMLQKRLGSPVHHRIYFAFAIPKNVLPDEKFSELLVSARDDPDRLIKLLLGYSSENRPTGGTWFAHILDRLDGAMCSDMDAEQLVGWLKAIADVMDGVLGQGVDRAPFMLTVGNRARLLFGVIVRELRDRDAAGVPSLLAEIMKTGRALSWLVGELTRAEIHAYISAGDGAVDPNKTFMLSDEIQASRQMLLSRVQVALQSSEVLSFPELSSFLYGWHQLDDGESVRVWIEEAIRSDETFLMVLLALRDYTWSDKLYRPLRQSAVELLLDWEMTETRVNDLCNSDKSSIANQAKELKIAIEFGKRD